MAPEGTLVTRVFGIRHHGPGTARALRRALADFQPDKILIEGPSDADPLVAYVAAADMTPPVALLAYAPDTPTRAAFWPFAVFSPEWQALRYATEHGVPVRFCDLPAATALALEDESGDTVDPLTELAAAAGYDDAERWWDAVVESVPDSAVFDAILEAMTALRAAAERDPVPIASNTAGAEPELAGTAPDLLGGRAEYAGNPLDAAGLEPGSAECGSIRSGSDSIGVAPDSVAEATDPAPDVMRRRLRVDAHTLRREAYMRQCLRKALKDGARRVAVVCGAWHAPALAGTLGPAAPDARLLKGLPKTRVALSWTPWTHSRLATASGYGAGVDAPGWYHHLFTETERPIVRWMTRVAGVLRARDLPVSSADVIESVRLAEALAGLRGRPLAGLSEVTDATLAVLCGGDETVVRWVAADLVVGEALGTVPADAPTVPLAADLRALGRTLRLKPDPEPRALELDLRRERDVERSRLLHRLRLLDIGWGRPRSGAVRATGTFRETWSLCWKPEFAVAVVEASRWGTTVRSAAQTRLLELIGGPSITVAELAEALELALLADLDGALGPLLARLESVAALDHDVTHLLAALPDLIRTLRYGDVRGTDRAALARVADGLLVRVCAGLPGAVTGLDTEAALALRAQLAAVHTAIHIREDSAATERWFAALHRLADRDDAHGALIGRAVRLLGDAGLIDGADCVRRLSAALSVGGAPAAKAAWIDGFVGGRGLLLVHDRELLRRIDSWLRDLTEDEFVAVLPLLRRTFGTFESGERRAIGRAVGDSASKVVPAEFDSERGALALTAANLVLGARP
ncbi:hypothetical protein D5S18_01670 [Nocardia panacis]|uniref:Uncharacterized protein n=1 Tax=Nocardia panacis TaxID=2340916 RepID=A0A3A4KUB0_9NOCA|nr:DUF5682 family protein [Nocardia panacis]RJO80077.1 hypothetical protein D5S18_01670 [Nocardia panacis]